MKFGKRLRNEAMPEWREEYLGYKKLKNLIKRLCSDDPEENFPTDILKQNKIFTDELAAELKKVENFFTKQSDETAKRAENLMKQLEELNNGSADNRGSTESGASDLGKWRVLKSKYLIFYFFILYREERQQ
jgi:SPX domain protein involved in polyphosphate accumulation